MPDSVWREVGGVQQKRCPTCAARGRDPWHPFEAYSPDADRKNGVAINCKQCLAENSAGYREQHPTYTDGYYAANTDDVLRRQRQRYADKIGAGWRKYNNRWIREESDDG